LKALNVAWLDRVYSPLVTLWVFLGQVLSADHSCRSAVARLIAHRVSQGQSPCSAETGAYCQARKRLAASSGAIEGPAEPWRRCPDATTPEGDSGNSLSFNGLGNGVGGNRTRAWQ